MIKDEGFALPTVPAKIARKTAETILEWSSDNKLAWKNFSEKIVAALSNCFQDHVQLGRIGKQREKMWAKYHQVRSSLFQNTWITFLESAGCDTACPVFYQFVTGSVMEQLIKLRYPIVALGSSDDEVILDDQECKVVRYTAGYTIRALLKKVGRSANVKQKDELKKCLQEMAEEADNSEHHSADWTRIMDRGKLIHVDDIVYSVFAEMELVIRQYLKGKKARDVQLHSTIDLILKDEDVLFSWCLASASWEQEIADVLLKMIATHWVTVRGFSFVMEKYKKHIKQTIQKSKGLRKQLPQKQKARAVDFDDNDDEDC